MKITGVELSQDYEQKLIDKISHQIVRSISPFLSSKIDTCTVTQASKILGVSEQTVRRYAREGELPSSRRAGKVIFLLKDLEKFIDEGKRF